MFQLSKSILWCVLCLASLVGLTVRLVGPVVVIAADLERQVASPIVPKNTPVVVAKITLDDKVVQTGRFAKPATELPDPITPFEAEDDWVQNTTVYLLNRTNRNLTYLYIVFGFPETLVGREERAFPLLLGVVPQSAFFDKVVNPSGRPIVNPTRAKPLLVRPGEILAIHLGDYIAQIQDRVGAYIPLKRLRQMNVTLQMCYFDDTVEWSGRFRIFDPDRRAWQQADGDYFPGDMDSRLPGRPGWPETANAK